MKWFKSEECANSESKTENEGMPNIFTLAKYNNYYYFMGRDSPQ